MARISRLTLITFFILSPIPLYASDAFIKTEKSIGQGFLIERQKTCYLVTPEHVVGDANNISFMTADRKSHKAEIIKIFDVDLAILEVDDHNVCLHKQPEAKTRLISLLKIYRDGVLKSRLSDGSILQTKVTIKGIDQSEYLQILPRKKSDILKQGFSGSLLYIADQPAGMLLEVDDENVGYVYRQDAISKKLSSHFIQDDKSINIKQEKKKILRVGSLKGDISQDKSIDYSFSWEENSPIIFNIQKAKKDYWYTFSILDAEGEQQFKGTTHRGSKNYKFAFTPTKSGVYTIRLVGTRDYGKFNIKVEQLTLDSQLRGAGNVVEVGDSLKGKIAVNSIAEFKYSGEENSPIIFNIQKAKKDYWYTFSILDAEGEQQFKGTQHRGSKNYKFAFTPTKSGIYTIQLVGTRDYGKFNIKVEQLTLDSQLRGAGNVVEVGDSLKGKIAVNSIAEFKYSGEENSPIIFNIQKAKKDYWYTFSILDAEGEQQFKGTQHRGSKNYKFAFTPTKSGIYTIQLVGTRDYGKFNIKVEQLTLESQLRGAGNVVEVGDSLKGKIAVNSIAEFKYSGEENSPIIFNIQKAKKDYWYTFSILDAEGEQQFKGTQHRGSKNYKFAFTPTKSGIYTIQLVGTRDYGKFNIKVEQLTLDSQLRGAGNVVEVGDSLKGEIAVNSIAEFKYSGEENSPIIFNIQKAKKDYWYTFSILDVEGEQQFKGTTHRGSKNYKFAFTPMESGIYTIRLVGTRDYGKFDIEVKK